jgi:dynein heavy chain
MEFLQMVKDKQQVYDVIFEPLKEIINVLSIYDVEIPEKTLQQLTELPEKYVNCLD